MALITVNCPHCGKELSAQSEWNGMNIGCPSCSQNFMLNIAVQSGDVNWHWAFIFIPGIHFVLLFMPSSGKDNKHGYAPDDSNVGASIFYIVLQLLLAMIAMLRTALTV